MLSGLIALCTRAAAEPATDEESGDENADRETSLDLLELDPLAALDTSRALSAEELAVLTPTLEAGEHGEAGDEIAARSAPARWGRIDLEVAWRREVHVPEAVEAAQVDDQLWVVLTWRR